MLARLEDTLCKLVMCLAWGANNDQLDLWVSEDSVESVVYLDAIRGLGTETSLKLASRTCWLPFKDRVQLEKFRKRKHERDMEGKTSKAYT